MTTKTHCRTVSELGVTDRNGRAGGGIIFEVFPSIFLVNVKKLGTVS